MMKKCISLLCVLCAWVGQVSAQSSYDIYTFHEPQGYKKSIQRDFISYTKTDSKTGAYCIISLYAHSLSSGDLAKDFNEDWANLVVKPFRVATAPQKDSGSEISGWKTRSGTANFEFAGKTSLALLTIAKKDNAKAAVLIATNAKSCLAEEVDPFFSQLKLAAPTVISSTNKTGAPESKATVKSNTPAQAKELIGEWYLSDGNAKMTLLFAANGRYDRGSMVDRKISGNLYETTTFLGQGAYSVKGNTLTLKPKSSAAETYQYRVVFEKNAENKIDKLLHLIQPVTAGQLHESTFYFVK